MDGLTVAGSLGTFAVDTQGAIVTLSRPSTSYIRASHASGALRFDTGGSVARLNIASNGDISFYDDTGTSPALHWDASAESLGIGTTFPAYSLDVSTNNVLTSRIQSSAGETILEIDNTNTNGRRYMIISGGNSGSLIGGKFGVFDATAGATRLAIDSSGRVGIGNVSPSAPLSVMAATSASVPAAGAASSHLAVGKNDQYGTMIGTLGSGDGYIQQQRFDGNTTTYNLLVQPNGGNVGIGTTSPWETLSIPFNEKLSFGSSAYPFSISRASAGELVTTFEDGYNASNARIEFKMRGGAVTPLSILGSGFVGIGTDSPAEALTVNGNIGISDGKIYNGASNNSAGVSLPNSTVRIDGYNGITFHSSSTTVGSQTERARIDSSGNLLVGTTNANVYNTTGDQGVAIKTTNLQVQRANGECLFLNRTGSDGTIADFRKDGTTVGSIGTNSGYVRIGTGDTHLLYHSGIDTIIPYSGSANRDAAISLGYSGARFKDLYLSGTGYFGTSVGIGTINPSYKVDILATNQTALRLNTTDADGCYLAIQTNGTAKGYLGSSHHLVFGTPSENDITLRAENNLQFTTGGGTERARIDSSGNLLVGTTDTALFNNTSGGGFCVGSSGMTQIAKQGGDAADPVLLLNQTGIDGEILRFYKDGTAVGNISVTGSATAYNTSSDARLKDVTGEARGLEVINELNPVSYNWKADGQADEGLIAQEVLDIVPNAVSGSEEDMYQMDYSKLVVHLVAGMKEQQTQIEELKQQIQNLTGE